MSAEHAQHTSSQSLRSKRSHEYSRWPIVGFKVFLNDEAAHGVPDEHRLATQCLSDSAYVVNVVDD
jgi:hypothetical protein